MLDDRQRVEEVLGLIRARVNGEFALSEDHCARMIESLIELGHVRGVQQGIKEARESIFPNGVVSR